MISKQTWGKSLAFYRRIYTPASCWKLLNSKGSIARWAMLWQSIFILNFFIKTELPLFTLWKVSYLVELAFGHLHYHLTDVLPQSSYPTDNVLIADCPDVKCRGIVLPLLLHLHFLEKLSLQNNSNKNIYMYSQGNLK